MSCYNHLTIEERECLMLSVEKGESIRQIAKKLGRAPSTISREIRRNPNPYRAVATQKNYRKRRKACVRCKYYLLMVTSTGTPRFQSEPLLTEFH